MAANTEIPVMNKTSTPVVYRWDDESNGEIYTDRSLELTQPIENSTTSTSTDIVESEGTTDSSIGLYVVENGKEYPLIPLRERKSMFESANQVKISYKIATASTTIVKKETLQEKSSHHAGVVVTAKPCSIIETKENVVGGVENVNQKHHQVCSKEAPIKSSTVPYIQEEEEILKNINLVSKIKPKFGSK